ncbi:glutathione S-transferase family protein [Sneathiella aquimaris]|uniref:glutathione S-transferase family protein n=1 Tax=Sneathiella aquimaris TaxID=2599305 RepID=UPI00146BC0D4|nr:glutathione S-transferase family protein [Sneathiella aquimaris]
MKLYDLVGPPSPRRIRIFLAEKGVEIDTVTIDTREGEHLKPEYQAINPRCTIPALEMDNGVVLTEGDAILRYLEEKFPEKPLFGQSPEERAVVNNWLHITDLDGFSAVAEVVRNSVPRFENRAITGSRNVAQIAELAERGKKRIDFYFEDLNAHLKGRDFIAGSTFTVADISAMIAIDFAKMAGKEVPEEYQDLLRWYASVSARPSAKA